MSGFRLEIDPLRLDKEWLEQPMLYHAAAVRAADAQHALDEAKAKMEQTWAETANNIRTNPELYEVAKATEKAVEEATYLQPDYKIEVKAYNRAKHEKALADADVQALDHRKRALTLLVELWIREYYIDKSPVARTAESEDWEKRQTRNRGRRRLEEQEVEVNE